MAETSDYSTITINRSKWTFLLVWLLVCTALYVLLVKDDYAIILAVPAGILLFAIISLLYSYRNAPYMSSLLYAVAGSLPFAIIISPLIYHDEIYFSLVTGYGILLLTLIVLVIKANLSIRVE